MTIELQRPTLADVEAACKQFDTDNGDVEDALKELFQQFPKNTHLPHVLLKVVALNRLYSTNIFAVRDAAKHIVSYGSQIDGSIFAGDSSIIKLLAEMPMPGKKMRNNFSFATKYCSWHNRDAFPIYDTRVEQYLWDIQTQQNFMQRSMKRNELWLYPSFSLVVRTFREYFGLQRFSFKDLDKYLWINGDRILSKQPS